MTIILHLTPDPSRMMQRDLVRQIEWLAEQYNMSEQWQVDVVLEEE